MTSSEVAALHSTTAPPAGLHVLPRSIPEAFAALTPIASALLDSSFHILQVSARYLTFNNLTSDECIGRNVFDLVKSKALVPGLVSLQLAIDRAIETKNVSVTSTSEYRDGRPFYASLRAVPIFEHDVLLYMLLEVQDNTAEHDRRVTLNDQLDTNDTYKVLVDTVKDYAIFMLDTKGNVRTWNAGAALLKGYKPEEIIGKHFSIFYGEEDKIAEKPRKELEICLRESKVEDEGWRYKKDGSRFWANVTITCVVRNGVHIGFSKVTRDLTERKAAESRVVAAYEESSKLKSAFLANTSHEIRTPLHGMLSALTLLMDTSLTPEQRELGSIIEESGSVLLQVINDILDYSKLSSGVFSIMTDVPVSIPALITSIVRGIQPSLKPRVTLGTNLGPNLPTTALGDPLRYRQVLQNLVANAVKFTESGSINIDASLVEEDASTYTVRTEITDTGIGIKDVAIASLFTPFTQFDASATKRYRGTGLGLSICKSLAELMGGAISFHPNPNGQGSVFWFTVKLHKINARNQVDRLSAKFVASTLSPVPDSLTLVRELAPGKRILLAEDNFINQKVMLMMLKGLGFGKVDIAVDGAEAVDRAKRNPLFYDLILMDVSMPVLDGVSATIQIRELGIETPIIAMTANAIKEDVTSYLARGMNDYVPKPVDRKVLLKAFLRWLK
ncbi:sensor histidine kinase/response regulator Fos-1/TcsA [Hyaloscypha hepaticicola]|uniref:Sensor histidine kinase/response regulator Fos-1/TcsA n=1 Tax=Hyaloscypha hepaticicola TaxID=2082293 RepID=A0A2J6QEP6_9HELO|nr:sensor histidine kinase/response regulator Fos-1/TcsA [Hyaloscypha hepaticicola]